MIFEKGHCFGEENLFPDDKTLHSNNYKVTCKSLTATVLYGNADEINKLLIKEDDTLLKIKKSYNIKF